MTVELKGIEPSSLGCRPSILPLNYNPILVSLAARRGIEPLSLHRQWSCDASRITSLVSCSRKGAPSKAERADREGIEPSLRGLEARLVSMTVRSKVARRDLRRGHCPRKWTRLHEKSLATRRRRVDSNRCTPHGIRAVDRRGLAPRSLALQASAITRLAHDPRCAGRPWRESNPSLHA